MEHILDFFNTWSRKAEELASNIWFNRKFSQILASVAQFGFSWSRSRGCSVLLIA